MHHKEVIRDAVIAHLLSRVGSLVSDIYGGRAGGVVADGELNVILVDYQASKANPELFQEPDSTEEVVYHLTVQPVVDGPEPDLADGLPNGADTIDDLTVRIRRALKREWALASGLGLPAHGAFDASTRLIEFRIVLRTGLNDTAADFDITLLGTVG